MKLVARQGFPIGTEFPLDKPRLSLGRRTEADVPIPDESVSRSHAQIRIEKDGMYITDLGSRNGTFVNGQPVSGSTPLRSGDVIRLGDTVFTVEEGYAPPRAYGTAELDWGPPAARDRRGKRSGIWLLVGVVGVLAVITVGLVFAMNRSRSASPTDATTATVASAVTEETPIASPTVAPSATAAPATATPEPVTTPEATAVPTPTPPLGIQTSPIPTLAATPLLTSLPAPAGTSLATVAPVVTSMASLVPPAVATSMATVLPADTVTAVPPSPSAAAPPTPQAQMVPPYTVTWNYSVYDPWAGGKRLRTELIIQNVSLPEMAPPYQPEYIILAGDGSVRTGEVQDYSAPGNELPVLAPGQSVTWTWYTIMPETDWVKASAFHYAGWNWVQQFNQDGTTSGTPQATSDESIIPLIPTIFPTGGEKSGIPSPEVIPSLIPTLLPMLPTIMPSLAP